MVINFIFFILILFVSYIGVEIFRRWTIKRNLLAVPNERSSHKNPTPSSGGVIISLVCLISLLIFRQISGENLYLPYVIGASVILIISFVDDVREVSPFLRLILHLVAAAIPVWAFGGFEILYIPFYGIINLGYFGTILAFVWIVWTISVYNFMDGIDGLAISEAIIAGLLWSVVGLLWNSDTAFYFGAFITFASIGFLIHNWQPAKIFMGDVGSAFLGFTFATFPLLIKNEVVQPEKTAILLWISLFIIWFFVFDMTFTSIKRTLRGEKLWQGAREHIYQKIVIAGYSHRFVSLFYGILQLILGAFLIFIIIHPKYLFFVFLLAVLELAFLLFIWRFITKENNKNHALTP